MYKLIFSETLVDIVRSFIRSFVHSFVRSFVQELLSEVRRIIVLSKVVLFIKDSTALK